MGQLMNSDSIWRTWKPYAVLAVLAIAGFWWWNSQSPAARLKDGVYDCVAVFVNQSNKYEVYVDSDGREFTGYARVQNGEITSYSAPNALSWLSGVELTVRKSGSSHFHATQDPAMHSYDALACDWTEQ